MELRHLRYFVAVVRNGSFSAAAEQLGRTQQAVSKAIAQLEERLGVRLLDRDARTPRPTAFGELLLERAEEIDAAGRVVASGRPLDLHAVPAVSADDGVSTAYASFAGRSA
jgi:molybdenum-dependent DNA-binding transcriptional regulator ModE